MIYSVDVPKGVHLAQYKPPKFRNWDCTESGPSEYDYLEGDWKRGYHRKYCAILTFEEFCAFLEHTDLYAEKCSTMGSLGAPGFGFGWAPAVSFNSDSQDAILNAYVTPIPPEDPAPLLPGMPEDVDQLDWDTVEKTMWNWFEQGAYSARQYAEQIANCV